MEFITLYMLKKKVGKNSKNLDKLLIYWHIQASRIMKYYYRNMQYSIFNLSFQVVIYHHEEKVQ